MYFKELGVFRNPKLTLVILQRFDPQFSHKLKQLKSTVKLDVLEKKKKEISDLSENSLEISCMWILEM